MTYTEAAKHNKQFNMGPTWTDPKALWDGKHHRWVVSPDNKIGFIAKQNTKEFLVYYPVKSMQVNYKLTVECHPLEDLDKFKILPL